MSSTYVRGNMLWLRFKGPDGKWTQASSGFSVGQEREAKAALKKLDLKIGAEREVRDAGGSPLDVALREGPLTVSRWSQAWQSTREGVVEDPGSDESRLRLHVLPVIGEMLLDEVRPRHLIALFKTLRAKKTLAPKTLWNVYAVVKALFRDAVLADLIEQTPCILNDVHLGPIVDADPEWRPTAVYTREELESLICDPRIPADRHVAYALEGLGGLRHGEMAGLRWRHYDPTTPVLGRLTVATSYDKGATKTKRPRLMPVHPTLAVILDEWKAFGWAQMMGRDPTADDLVVPMPEPTNRGPRVPKGSMRTDHHSYKRLKADLETLGFRHRRGHDLRRTMISLARVDGARGEILEICSHNPGKSGKTVDLYTSFPWTSLATEIAKLQVERRVHRKVLPAKAVGAERESPSESTEDSEGLATGLATVLAAPSSGRDDSWWRRRESNPRPKAVYGRRTTRFFRDLYSLTTPTDRLRLEFPTSFSPSRRPGHREGQPHWVHRDPLEEAVLGPMRLANLLQAARASSTLSLAFLVFQSRFNAVIWTRDVPPNAFFPCRNQVAPIGEPVVTVHTRFHSTMGVQT